MEDEPFEILGWVRAANTRCATLGSALPRSAAFGHAPWRVRQPGTLSDIAETGGLMLR